MKLSTKILSGLLLFILGLLVFSNFTFKRRYDQIDKSDPYWDFKKVFEQPFKYIKIQDGNITNIVFEQNPKPSVRISDHWDGFEKEMLKPFVRNDTLYLLFRKAAPEDYFLKEWMERTVLVRVFAPQLLTVEGFNTNFNLVKLDQKNLSISLSGKSALEVETYSPHFDQLNIRESDSSVVFFEMSPDIKSSGTIQIDTVHADLKGLSWLGLGHAQIKVLYRSMEDSAAIELSGATLKNMKN